MPKILVDEESLREMRRMLHQMTQELDALLTDGETLRRHVHIAVASEQRGPGRVFRRPEGVDDIPTVPGEGPSITLDLMRAAIDDAAERGREGEPVCL